MTKMKRIDLKTALRKLYAYRLDDRYTFDETCRLSERWQARACAYARGETCVKAGVPTDDIALVASGCLFVKRPSPDGEDILLHVVRPGGCSGAEQVVAARTESPYELVAAVDDTEVVLVSAALLRKHRSEPGMRPILDFLMRRLGETMAEAIEKNAILAGGDIEERLRRYLALRLGKTGAKTVQMEGTRDDLAAYLGVNRCALSRVIGRLRDEGKLALGRGSITVLG